jgi:ribonucleoside-triphosphate reductase
VCNSETEVYARIVGYLRPVKQWNEGKRAEFDLRKSFALTGDSAYVLEQEQFPSVHEQEVPYLQRKVG